MEIESLLLGWSQQQGGSTYADGTHRRLRATRAGQLMTIDWKSELIWAGQAYNVTVGSLSAGADIAQVTGGGAGTTIDSDQPELGVGTPTGYYHIPLSFEFAGQADIDADQEEGNVILFADRGAQLAATGVTGTAFTPQNLLDGGPGSVSSCWHTITGDVTDPVMDMLLAWATTQCSEVTAAGYSFPQLKLSWQAPHPILFKGPASVYACWGGTAAVTGMASYCWAEVPINRFQ